MTKSVELLGSRYSDDDDTLLHFDGDRLQPVVDAVWKTIREEAVRQNPGKDPDELMQRMLCGGCLATFMSALHEKILQEGDASKSDRVRYHARLADRHDATAIMGGKSGLGALLMELMR